MNCHAASGTGGWLFTAASNRFLVLLKASIVRASSVFASPWTSRWLAVITAPGAGAFHG